MSRRVSVGLCSAILLVLASLAASRAQEPESTTPEEFQPFEYLLGAWKGTSVPTANKLRGWVEKHQWSWKFAKGKPVGMAFTMQDSKVFSKGLLTYNAQTKTYVIEAEGPKGEKHEYTGTLNEAGDVLKFDRKAGATGGGRERVVFGFLDNKIRYTMKVDRKPAGSPDYTREIDTGLTKEGEAFAAGGASADLPKCIVTGGSAALTVSFNGQTYPVCCSGCIDEFKDNPEKYLKKYALRMQKESGDGLAKAEAPAAKDADLPKAKGALSDAKKTSKADAKTAAKDDSEEAEDPAPVAKKAVAKGAATKAASLLRQAQSLEKADRKAAALSYYKRIVKDHADSKEAKTAKDRIKALEDK